MSTTPRVASMSLVTMIVLVGCGVTPTDEATGVAELAERTTANQLGSNGMKMVTVPIRGVWDNTESAPSANPPAGCLVHIETTQTGHASHVGRFTGTGETCVTSQTPTDSPPFWDHEPAPPYGVMDFTNAMVWRAADGDELWLRPNGGVFVLSLATGAASVRGQLTIAGGTGRFEGATGRMDVTGGREAGEPGDHLEYEGEITMRPGSAAR